VEHVEDEPGRHCHALRVRQHGHTSRVHPQDPEMALVRRAKFLRSRILDRKSEAAPLSKQSECHHPKSRAHALLVHVKGGGTLTKVGALLEHSC